MRFKSVFAGVMAFCTALMQCPVQAAGQVLPNMPTQMNLGSQAKTYVVPSGFTPTTIRVNNHPLSVTSGSALTPAEAVALQQVLTTGHQLIILNAFGAARGGTFNLPMAETLSSLTIPARVTVLRDFSNNTALNLSGDLLNSGKLFAYATALGSTNALIGADTITNKAGALISTVIPRGGLPGVPNALTHLDLSLVAKTINNAGTISSSGNLLLNSPSGDLLVKGTGGTFSALGGDINVRETGYAGSANTTLFGGNYIANNVNLNGGEGTVNAKLGVVKATLNSHAGIEHIFASTPNLVLGHNVVTGDPIFVNDSGNVTINGTNTFGEDVAIIASGNISDNGGQSLINALGHKVSLIAGANVAQITPGGATTTTVSGSPTSTVTSVQITGGSSAGGNVLFGSSPGTVIDTSSGTGAGGDVLVAAFAGNAGQNGQIIFASGGSTDTINTCSNSATATSSGSSGGNVDIIAGGQVAQINGIFTAGYPGGHVNVTMAQPVTNDSGTAGSAFFDAPGATGGALRGTSTITPSATLTSGTTLTLGNIVTGGGGAKAQTSNGAAGLSGGSGGAINILTGGSLTTGNLVSYGGGGAGGNDNDGGNGGNGGVIAVSAQGATLINGSVNSSGGGGGGGCAAVGGSGGSAGNITIFSNGFPFSISGVVLAADGGNGGGNLTDATASGGGSFGGGGGAASAAVGGEAGGGAGMAGGAGANQTGGSSSGGGGGALGAGTNPGNSALNGSIGIGGASSLTQAKFGAAGAVASGSATGSNVSIGNTNTTISLTGPLVSVGGKVSALGGPAFSSSSYKDVSVWADKVTLTGTGSLSGAIGATGVVTANFLTLSAPAGSVNSLQVNAANLSANANGFMTLTLLAPVTTLTGVNTAGTYTLNNTTGGSVVLASGQTLTGTYKVFISLTGGAGTFTQADGTASIQTPHIQFVTHTGDIGSAGQPLLVSGLVELIANPDNLVNGVSNVWVTNSTTGNLDILNSNVGSLHLTTAGTINVPSGMGIVAGTTIDVSTGTGITFGPTGSGSLFSAPTVSLSAASGNIGTQTHVVALTTNALSATAPGDVYITAVPKNFGLPITINALQGDKVSLSASGQSLSIAAGVQITGSTSVALSANAKSITQADSAALITTPLLTLDTGTVGSGAQPLLADVDTLQI